jgi:hypothetical protein
MLGLVFLCVCWIFLLQIHFPWPSTFNLEFLAFFFISLVVLTQLEFCDCPTREQRNYSVVIVSLFLTHLETHWECPKNSSPCATIPPFSSTLSSLCSRVEMCHLEKVDALTCGAYLVKSATTTRKNNLSEPFVEI